MPRKGTFTLMSSALENSDSPSPMQSRVAIIRERIASTCLRVNRDPEKIRLIWVSKNHSQAEIQEAYALGARLFGENRVQEAAEKFPLPPDARGVAWDYELHLIGHLQSNKIRKAVALGSAIHSVDSITLWESINRIAGELGKQIQVFLQVNTSMEDQKSGFTAKDLLEKAHVLPEAPHLRLMGFMTMGPMEGNAESSRPCFRRLRSLLEQCNSHPQWKARFPEARFLSMGMTADFESALEEGAHYLRLGTALFGPRET